MTEISDRDQALQDFHFVQNLIVNNDNIVDVGVPERKVSVLEILERAVQRGSRRGGPTKGQLLQLRDLAPGEFTVGQQRPKGEMLRELIRNINGETEDAPREGPVVEGPPVGPVPEGWGNFAPPNVPRESGRLKPLLLLRRGSLTNSKGEQLQMLLQEQEELNLTKPDGDPDLINYLRENLREMTGNDSPVPESDQWVYFIYEKALEKEIQRFRGLFDNQSKSGGSAKPIAISSEDEGRGRVTTGSDSDSDLSSYFPKKRFAISLSERGMSRKKRKSKRKKSKRKKRRKKRSKRGTSSSSVEESSSSDSDQVEPNGRRVSKKAYAGTHYEQLEEFREDYATYCKDGEHGNWPSEDAMGFISKKFARPGSKFAKKNNKGVKQRFAEYKERMHAKQRTVQIYDMADTVAELRLDRHNMIAKEMRRVQGARAAKAARIRQNLRKRKRASELEEQVLVAKVGVYCDLVLMGKEAWNKYHDELTLGGQREAVMESMGGGSPKPWPPRRGKRRNRRHCIPSGPGNGTQSPSRRPLQCRRQQEERCQQEERGRRRPPGVSHRVTTATSKGTGAEFARISWQGSPATRSPGGRDGTRKRATRRRRTNNMRGRRGHGVARKLVQRRKCQGAKILSRIGQYCEASKSRE